MSRAEPRRMALVVPKTPRFTRRPSLRSLWRESRRFRDSFFLRPQPSLGLLSLASYLPESLEAVYLDENFGPVDLKKRVDGAAVTLLTCQAPGAYRLAGRFRRRGAHVVLGGMHPTVRTREALRHGDTVITGEGEVPWLDFLRDYLRGSPGRLYRSAPQKRCNLRSAGEPRYELARRLPYRSMPVQIGRGCGLQCEFCSAEAVHGRRYRHKTAAQVRGEINRIRELWGEKVPEVFFTDDNLLLHRQVMTGVLEAVEDLGIRWTAQMDASVGRRSDLLRLMRRSGCGRLLVSFDGPLAPGGTDRLKHWGDLVRPIQEAGIEVLGMFILGADGDRGDLFRRIGDFVGEHGLRDAQFSIQTPLPGSNLYRRLQRQKRLADPLRWEEFDFFHLLFQPRHVTGRQLLRGQTALYRQLYGS